MRDEDVYRAILDAAAAGRQVALATVLRTRGSVPRHAGSKMVIDPDGGMVGTIGGGCGEADVKREAIEVIRTRKPRMVRVDLLDDISSDSPAVCGGIMNIFIDPWWEERDAEAPSKK